MNKLMTASIDVTKIDKSKLIEGRKGKYLNLLIWFNEEPDQYGNNFSIQQKDCKGVYLGNGKYYVPKEEQTDNLEGKFQKKGQEIEESDLPF